MLFAQNLIIVIIKRSENFVSRMSRLLAILGMGQALRNLA